MILKVKELQRLTAFVNNMRKETGETWGLVFKLWLKDVQKEILPVSVSVSELIEEAAKPFVDRKADLDREHLPDGEEFVVIGERDIGGLLIEVYKQKNDDLYNIAILKLKEEFKDKFDLIDKLVESDKTFNFEPIHESELHKTITQQQIDGIDDYIIRENKVNRE